MVRKAKPQPKPAAADVLDRLESHEAAAVLRTLLQRHPDLRVEAREIATATMTKVDVEALADEVESEVSGVSEESFEGRAGSHSWGYTSPGDAVSELLEEALEPFLTDMKRLVQLGHDAAALATCQGIVRGLYQVESRKSRDGVLEYAPDFPGEAARNAVDELLEESRKKHGHRWQPPDSFFEETPAKWESWIREAAAARRR